jgi:hypothetical protein
MAFWTDISLVTPLRQYTWYIDFSEELSDFKFALKECKKPEFEIGVTEHRLLTHTFRYPGLLKWKPVTIKFASVFSQGKNLTDAINLINKNSGYNTPISGHQQINKSSMILDQSFITITQVEEEGADIEKWRLYNPFISNADFGSLSYSSEEIVDVTLTIQYDHATLVDV